jgi:hypothetical protein
LSTQDWHEIVDPKVVDRLRQSNLSRLEALANQGISLSVGDLAFIKMEALIELLVPSEDQKLKLDYTVELKKKEIIDQVMTEIRKAQLLEGVQQTASKLKVK